MTTTTSTRADIRRARQRFHTDIGWLESWHSFSFGHHFNPNELGHGLLIVSNDDVVAPGGGFGSHPHADMEIVTWVLDGELEHRDSEGNHGVIGPGLAQRMSAGTGIVHSEFNASSTAPARLVQMWVVPSQTGITPGYEQVDVTDRLDAGGWVAIASGQGHEGAVTIHQPGAVMRVARMGERERLDVPRAPYVHVFVATGTVAVDLEDLAGDQWNGTTLNQGDALRLTGEQAAALTALERAEVIVWESDRQARR
ncbi:MAG: pirin family protein [Microthrixaceae bacterium]